MQLMVPHDALVRIPAVAADDTAQSESDLSSSASCYRVCKCGRHNLLHQCRDISCVPPGHCQLDYGMIQGTPIDHVFFLEDLASASRRWSWS